MKTKTHIWIISYLIFIILFTFTTICAAAPQDYKVNDKVVKKEPKQITNDKQIDVIATAYCPCEICCGKSDGITASGKKAKANHTIAVDPDVIPYGTEVIINGNTYIAEDKGGAIQGNTIDIFFDSHEDALNFGRKTLTVIIRYKGEKRNDTSYKK